MYNLTKKFPSKFKKKRPSPKLAFPLYSTLQTQASILPNLVEDQRRGWWSRQRKVGFVNGLYSRFSFKDTTVDMGREWGHTSSSHGGGLVAQLLCSFLASITIIFVVLWSASECLREREDMSFLCILILNLASTIAKRKKNSFFFFYQNIQ